MGRNKSGRKRLFIKDLVSIGAVDSGDNPGADIVFWKSASADSAELTQEGNPMSDDILDDPIEAEAEAVEADAIDSELEALIEDELVEVGKADEIEALIVKQREELEAVRKELADKDAMLAAEVSKRRDTEFITKVRDDDLEALLGNADEIGPALRALADAAPEAFDKVYPTLHAAAQRLSLAGVFEELGENKGESDPVSKRDAWVAKRKQDGDLRSDAVLRSEFWAAHPDERESLREIK